MFAMRRSDFVAYRQQAKQEQRNAKATTAASTLSNGTECKVKLKEALKPTKKFTAKSTTANKKPLWRVNAEKALEMEVIDRQRKEHKLPIRQQAQYGQAQRTSACRVDKQQRGASIKQAQNKKVVSPPTPPPSPQRTRLSALLDSIEDSNTNGTERLATGRWNMCWLPEGMPVQTMLTGASYRC